MRRLWQDESITIVGRRNLIERHIIPRVKEGLRFVLVGSRGSGKTALLEVAFDCCKDKKCLTSAHKTLSDICKQIVRDWEIQVEAERAKPTVEEMRRAILQTEGNNLFIDDIQFVGSAANKIEFISALADRHRIYGTIMKGMLRDKIKPLFLKMGKEIKVNPLNRKDSEKLAKRVVLHFGSLLNSKDITNAAGGLAGKIVVYAKNNEIRHDEIRESSEELNLAPVILIIMACGMLFRYIGRATNSTDFVILGGIAIVMMIFARGIFTGGREQK